MASRLLTPEIIALVRGFVEDVYTGTMTVYVNEYVTDENGLEIQQWKARYEDEPCRVSRQNAPQPTDKRPKVFAEITQLTCAPELQIPAGSKITIDFNGRVEDYTRTGEPRVYTTHQNIFIKTWDRDTRDYA